MRVEKGTDFLDRDQLRHYFEKGCKPNSEWGIGSEYENFILALDLKKTHRLRWPKVYYHSV